MFRRRKTILLRDPLTGQPVEIDARTGKILGDLTPPPVAVDEDESSTGRIVRDTRAAIKIVIADMLAQQRRKGRRDLAIVIGSMAVIAAISVAVVLAVILHHHH